MALLLAPPPCFFRPAVIHSPANPPNPPSPCNPLFPLALPCNLPTGTRINAKSCAYLSYIQCTLDCVEAKIPRLFPSPRSN